MDAAIAALCGSLAGAAVTGAATIGAQVVSARSANSNQRKESESARLSEYLSATYKLVLSMGPVAHGPRDQKYALEREYVWPCTDRVNTALSAIVLNDHHEIASAADTFDRTLVRLIRKARDDQYTGTTWREVRENEIAGPLSDLKSKARRLIHGPD